MAILEIKRAAERKLNTLTPVIPTAYESLAFTPPNAGMYQRVQFNINPPDDPVLGVGFHRERITMQVFVSGDSNKGTGEVLARAEAIRTLFRKGTFMLEGDIRIHVLSTPQIAGTSVYNDRVICPVLIELTSEIYDWID